MSDNYFPVTIIFICFLILLSITLFALGYRVVRGKRSKAVVKHDSTQSEDLPEAYAYQQLPLDEAMTALASIEDGVVIADINHQIIYLNNSAIRIIDVKPDKWQGLTFIEVIKDHECDAVLKKCIDTGQMQYSVIRIHRFNQFLQVTALPGYITGNYIVIIKDFTERQRIEQIRKDLVTNIAHELRTPIASIKLLTETLSQGAINEPEISADFLKKIYTESNKLQKMTDDLSKLAKLEGGGEILERVNTDIVSLIKHSVERLTAQASSKGMTIDVSVEAGIPSPVIDREGLESVIINLLHNAIKNTEPSGHIYIGAKREDNMILVHIADTGRGIPPDDIPHIFERFYKVDKSRNSEGSGLGLAISKHAIASHGGRIWVESTEGKGSTFYFTLPLPS